MGSESPYVSRKGIANDVTRESTRDLHRSREPSGDIKFDSHWLLIRVTKHLILIGFQQLFVKSDSSILR